MDYVRGMDVSWSRFTNSPWLRRLSLTDELTGLHDLRGFTAEGRAALRVARKRGQACLLAFLASTV